MKKVIFTLFFIIFIFTISWTYFYFAKTEDNLAILDFESCVASQKIISQIYPPQCITKDGRVFVEDIGNELEKSDLIRVSFPRPGGKIGSPFVIKGEARGYWFFEASFPVRLIDSSGVLLAQGIATAKDEWMTENFVPFEATLLFEKPTTINGKIILMKDNPSGLKEHDDSLEIPVIF